MDSLLSDTTPPTAGHKAATRGRVADFLVRHGALIAIFVVAFAMRAPTFGNPILEFDEQLYLVVGDRMLHGALPYVDLWDRKPIGLFLFYAAIRLLGGTGIIQYQVVATLCAAGTAALIHAMARRRAGPIASLAVALIYLHELIPLHGDGGQAPVLYNLVTAAAALAAFRATETQDRRRTVRLALASMAGFGVAIQFKYTPVVEGVFFGCFFVWRLWSLGQPLGRLAATAAAMIATALAPSLAAIGFYAATGHLDAFVQSNLVSIFQRAPLPGYTRINQRVFVAFLALPPTAAALYGAVRGWRGWAADNPSALVLLIGWPLTAFGGFAMLGDIWSHYFITVLPPLLILAASALRPGPAGFTAGCILFVWPVLLPLQNFWRTAEDRAATDRLVATIRPYVRDRCLYVYDGPTVLYMLTDACIPTRFVYPDHLTDPTETPALGVDAAQEEARILATRPGAIVTSATPILPHLDPATQAVAKAALARDYVLVARVPTSTRTHYVWALRSLHPGPAPIVDPRAATPN